MKKMILHNPVVIKLEEGKDEQNRLTHYSVKCLDADKFLLLFFIIKLRLINGKCIIFVNEVDRAYRLKLFLEQFSIRSCLMNSELPYSSRFHIVQEFNRGIYPYMIATDEMDLKSADGTAAEGGSENNEPSTDNAAAVPEKSSKKKKQSAVGGRKDKEYGVSRGIDFKDVDAVINFDFPATARAYTHRAGRTARANKSGMGK